MRRSILWCVMALMTLSGCHARFQFPAEIPSSKVVQLERNYFLWGFVGENNFELYQYCTEGHAYEIHVYTSFLQGVITAFTGGLYAPRTITITCSARGHANEMLENPSQDMDKAAAPEMEKSEKMEPKKTKKSDMMDSKNKPKNMGDEPPKPRSKPKAFED